jgi:catechol-2,3-dioxygenase
VVDRSANADGSPQMRSVNRGYTGGSRISRTNRLGYVVSKTADRVRARALYTDVLGMEIMDDHSRAVAAVPHRSAMLVCQA